MTRPGSFGLPVWRLSTLLCGCFLALSAVAPLHAQTRVTLPPELRSVALPKDINIVLPDPDVPADLAAFSGVWGGIWDYQRRLPNVLAVEQIVMEPTPHATVVYAWGNGSPAPPSYYRVQAAFVGGTLYVAIPPGSRMTYRIRPDGTLDGHHQVETYSAQAVLKRISTSP